MTARANGLVSRILENRVVRNDDTLQPTTARCQEIFSLSDGGKAAGAVAGRTREKREKREKRGRSRGDAEPC